MLRAAATSVLLLLAMPAQSAERIIVQSTTSTANSGLYDHLLPIFESQHGISVRIVAVGSGQAIRNASNCDGDVLLVHAREAEERFVAEGKGIARHDVMYNDFVLVGPAQDAAKVTGQKTAESALHAISAAQARFVSRSDDSGTHRKEMALWQAAGIDPLPASGTWYLETGAGMGATLNTGIGLEAYVLTDRATWLAFGNKADYGIVLEGDSALFNQYGIIAVSPDHCPSVRADLAQRFVDWIISSAGQDAIGSYRRDGAQLFFPNAKASP